MYKGIVLAGGQGTRLYPSSLVVSKQLINVYDKPLIYYSISTLMWAKIKDILIITTPDSISQFKDLLGDGSQWGVNFEYQVQEEPKGVADALILGENFIGDDNVCLILGDNFIYGNELDAVLEKCKTENGATVLSYPVKDPERFGVVEFDGECKVTSIEEKPDNPKSNQAVIGMYFYDKNAPKYAKQVIPSDRGEIEITDLNKIYLEKGLLNVCSLKRGIAWMDAGTFDSLLTVSNFVQTIEKIQSYKICCPEEIAYRNNWIDRNQLLQLSMKYAKSGYGEYLKRIADN
jgi:glucose-1-phosphate thymidylyltransferase